MALAMRLYGIISAAQKGTPTKEELGELTAEEAKMYDEIRQETLQLQAEGKPLPMYMKTQTFTPTTLMMTWRRTLRN